ncbi:iron ABC transporter permease [Corallincola platygyrae]
MRGVFSANLLSSGAIMVALVLLVPILMIPGLAWFVADDSAINGLSAGAASVWLHLWQTVLGDYLFNSFALMLGVGVGVLMLGVPAAWLTSRYEFPMRRALSLLLLLPMAVPAYIIAYTYTGLLDFAGPIQTAIREWTGLRYGQYWFPEVRSLGGAMVMLSLVLYPYVYLMSRAAFIVQPRHMFDAGRSLGMSPFQNFYRLALPLARPAIVAGLSLALMETLADYGTVQYFGVSTFTTGIFRTFYGFGDTAAAAQLAMMLLGFVLTLLVIEKYSRRRIRYFSHAEQGQLQQRESLTGWKRWLATLACVVPPLFGFLVPAAVLIGWSLQSEELLSADFIQLTWNTFSLAGMAAVISVFLALVLAYAARSRPKGVVGWAVQLVSMGYALPGTIIAIGVMVCLIWVDHHWVVYLEQLFSVDLGLLLSGTLVALIFAYTIRFLAISLGAVQSGLQGIKPSLDQSARSLGKSPIQTLRLIHIPLLKSSVLTALLIVFVDVLKELPATLMLRPFNFNTLAVRAYEMASDERLMDAAPASMMIVLVGLIPVIWLNRSIASMGKHQQTREEAIA